jgi:predicted hydrocarbon binding protein
MTSVPDPRSLIRHLAVQAAPDRGTLRHLTGNVSKVSLELVHGFHASLVGQFPENAADVLYRCGYEWALQDMVGLNSRLREEIGGSGFDLWQMEAKFVYESWWTLLQDTGWGRCTFDFGSATRGILVIQLQGSAVAAALAGSEEPVCHLHAGMFAGAVSFFDRGERHAVELQCAAMGAESCQFIVGSGADIDAAETWRQQGTSAGEIIRRFR